MTLYKNIDNSIKLLCNDCMQGKISIGEFQSSLLANINQIVSIEDKDIRNYLYDLEACLDGNLALYYGAYEINNLQNKFVSDDVYLENLIAPIIENIQKAVCTKL